MRSLLLVSIVSIGIASGATVYAQAPKPATPPTGSAQPAKPAATPATGNTGAKPATGAAPAPAAQPPAPAPAPPTTAKPATPPTVPPPSSESYSYQTEGRRDPFTNLIATGGNEARPTGNAKLGPAGMTVAEIQVRGVMQSRGSLIAMIMGSDNKTYIVHQGDKLLDGTIKQITPQGLVITQEVNDPLSLVKQREVRKLLRSLEDAK